MALLRPPFKEYYDWKSGTDRNWANLIARFTLSLFLSNGFGVRPTDRMSEALILARDTVAFA